MIADIKLTPRVMKTKWDNETPSNVSIWRLRPIGSLAACHVTCRPIRRENKNHVTTGRRRIGQNTRWPAGMPQGNVANITCRRPGWNYLWAWRSWWPRWRWGGTTRRVRRVCCWRGPSRSYGGWLVRVGVLAGRNHRVAADWETGAVLGNELMTAWRHNNV